jgi:hypothetical protein
MIWATGDGWVGGGFAGRSRSAEHPKSLDICRPGGAPLRPHRRHAGHADIILELIDGAAGDDDGNVPDQIAQEWASYRLRLEQAAAEAALRADDARP